MKKSFFSLFLALITIVSYGQDNWTARWITHPEVKSGQYSVVHFRNSFIRENITQPAIIHISADTRYKLYLNGHYLGEGPANNDLRHYSYDSYDLQPFLKTGGNVMAAVVWSFGELNPIRYESEKARLWVQSKEDDLASLNTGSGNWKTIENEAITPTLRGMDFNLDGYYAMGGGEEINGDAYPWGWKDPDFNDSHWAQPNATNVPITYGSTLGYGEAALSLSPRTIPMMDVSEENLPELREVRGYLPSGIWLKGEPVEIPPNSESIIILDQEYLTKGHPFFTFSKGKGATIEVIYAESLFNPDGSKGNRNDTEGKMIQGLMDRFLLDGDTNKTYSPLFSRTWRYLQVTIRTEDEPVEWNKYGAKKFIYPFKQTAEFTSEDTLHQDILEAGWRTAMLCADETYMDTPYYEQLQYIGDTRVQALISLYYSGDDRLMRNALTQFGHSITDEGITQSRYPSNLIQYIPPYSLFMINMLHDFHMYRDDDAFTENFLNKVTSILYWFESRLREDHLLGPMPWWSYVDAISEFQRSSPPGSWEGGSIILSLQYVYALQDAIDLYTYFGKHALAEHFAGVKQAIQQSVWSQGYDEENSLLADTPDKRSFSQHAAILAILTDTAPKELQPDMFTKITSDTSVTRANIYFRYYLFQAAQHAGMGEYFINNLDLWENMLSQGLTTYSEHLNNTRSDCHAWSAYPNIEFFRIVLGIQPLEPHFSRILISPNPGDLKNISGTVPHPLGEIRVEINMENDITTFAINIPSGTSGKLEWEGEEYPLQAGENEYRIE